MAIYTTDFSEYTVDVGLHIGAGDWTRHWGTTWGTVTCKDWGDYGDNAAVLYTTTSVRYASSWDDVGTPTDVEVLGRLRISSDTNHICRLYVRGGGAYGSEDAYFGYIQPLTDKVGIHKYVAGVSTNIASGEKTIDQDEWYWTRFRVSGEAVQLRVWSGEFSSEPVGWDIDETDSDISGSGWVGFGGGAESNYEAYTDWFSAATAGDEAEGPAEASGESTYSSVMVMST